MKPAPSSSIQVEETCPQTFTLTVTFDGRRFECGTYISRPAAMQAGRLFVQRKEAEVAGSRAKRKHGRAEGMASTSGKDDGAGATGRTRGEWARLSAELKAATGADAALDQAVAEAFQVPSADYTESVERCRALVASALPGWHLHLGYGVSGVLPYAELSSGDRRHVAEAPTVPLAILRALVAAKLD